MMKKTLLALTACAALVMPPARANIAASTVKFVAAHPKLTLVTGATLVGAWYKGSEACLFSRALADTAWGHAYLHDLNAAISSIGVSLRTATDINARVLSVGRISTHIQQQVNHTNYGNGQQMTQAGVPSVNAALLTHTLNKQLFAGTYNTDGYAPAQLSDPYRLVTFIKGKGAAFSFGVDTHNPLDAYLSHTGRQAAETFAKTAAAIITTGQATNEALQRVDDAFDTFMREAKAVQDALKTHKNAIEWALWCRRAL